jgi:hypothetical protein
MAFSSTEDIVLIKLVAQHSAFYDLKHAQYKVHNVLENVWAEIGEKLGKTGNRSRGVSRDLPVSTSDATQLSPGSLLVRLKVIKEALECLRVSLTK